MKSSETEVEQDIHIKVKAIPRAKKNQISGIMDDGSLKVRISAPPVDGKANRALIKLLADNLNIPQSDIKIISGIHGRNKTVKIMGINSTEFTRIIHQLVD